MTGTSYLDAHAKALKERERCIELVRAGAVAMLVPLVGAEDGPVLADVFMRMVGPNAADIGERISNWPDEGSRLSFLRGRVERELLRLMGSLVGGCASGTPNHALGGSPNAYAAVRRWDARRLAGDL